MGAMRKDAERLWNANASLPKLVAKKEAKKTVKDNPHSFDYGTSYSTAERAYSFNVAKKHKGRYYGPKYKEVAWILKDLAYPIKRNGMIGIRQTISLDSEVCQTL